MTQTRRFILVAAAAVMLPRPARAGVLEHAGFRIDMDAAPEAGREALEASLRAQIDLVESLAVDPELKRWFRTVPVVIDPTLEQPGRANATGVWLNAETSPAENPVLLHEYLHVYQARRLAPVGRNAEIDVFYQRARESGDWPERAYMLRNLQEFFAMTGSVALWGRAARPPGTRERLVAQMPDWVAWLDREFGRQG